MKKEVGITDVLSLLANRAYVEGNINCISGIIEALIMQKSEMHKDIKEIEKKLEEISKKIGSSLNISKEDMKNLFH